MPVALLLAFKPLAFQLGGPSILSPRPPPPLSMRPVLCVFTYLFLMRFLEPSPTLSLPSTSQLVETQALVNTRSLVTYYEMGDGQGLAGHFSDPRTEGSGRRGFMSGARPA